MFFWKRKNRKIMQNEINIYLERRLAFLRCEIKKRHFYFYPTDVDDAKNASAKYIINDRGKVIRDIKLYSLADDNIFKTPFTKLSPAIIDYITKNDGKF